MTRIINLRTILSVAILALGIIFSYAAFAQDFGQEGPTQAEIAKAGITFPVAELGNCTNKEECRDYCNDTSNMKACIAFAKAHGLMNEAEAGRAEKFRGQMEVGGGPGGCRSPVDCEAYCSSITNIEECIAFADEEGFDDPEIEEARKIASYLRAGGKMPGGCVSEQSCMEYCGDFSHARECFEFATQSGLAQEGEFGDEGDIPSPEQFQKLIELTERGETPGGCKGRGECESYCREPGNFEECIVFAEKMGFVGSEEAELARKTGGFGPGGCDSHGSCASYCNDPANQEECFAFAKERGLISESDLEHTREGFVRLRQGLGHAPPEVRACLKSVLGPNIIEDIQSGNLVPGPDIGDRVRQCFGKFGRDSDPRGAFSDAPPKVLECVRGKIGDVFNKIVSGAALPTPEMGDAFRVCFQQIDFERDGFDFGPGSPGGGPPPGEFFEFLRSAPPDVQVCLKGKLGDRFERLQGGDESALGADLGNVVRGCFESFRPPDVQFDEEHGGFEPKFGGGFIENVPPEIQECVVRSAGREFLERALRGEIPRYEIEPVIGQCFRENYEGGAGAAGGGEGGALHQASPAVQECVRQKKGQGFFDAMLRGELSREIVENAMRACFQEQEVEEVKRFDGDFPESGFEPVPLPVFPPDGGGFLPPPGGGDGVLGLLEGLPPGVVECVKSSLGFNVLERVQRGEVSAVEIEGRIKVCYEKLQSGGFAPPSIEPVPISEPVLDFDPARQCIEKGGTWDGSACIITATPQPPLIIDLTKECTDKGGVWDGSACIITTTPQSTEAGGGNFLDAIKRFLFGG